MTKNYERSDERLGHYEEMTKYERSDEELWRICELGPELGKSAHSNSYGKLRR
jgi:hypothetical protein